MILKISQFYRKTSELESLFNRVAGLDVALVLLLLTLNICYTFIVTPLSGFVVDFEQVNISWEEAEEDITVGKVSKYGVFQVCIQFDCGKIRNRKNSVFGHFSHSVWNKDDYWKALLFKWSFI